MPSSARRGFDRGTCHYGPLRTRFKPEGQSREFESEVLSWNPRLVCDRLLECDGRVPVYDIELPLADSTANTNTIGTTTNGTVAFRVPHTGYITGAFFTAKAALATDETNYLTFTLTNKLGAGSGSAAMLAATANLTKTTGGTALAANTPFTLTLSATAAALRVAAGDVLIFSATSSGTLANAVTQPTIHLRFAMLPDGWSPYIVRTAGSPLVGVLANTANGEITCVPSATSEAQTAGIHWSDQVVIPPTKGPYFSAYVKIDVLPAANERIVIGLASAANATFDSVTTNAWFRLEASGALEAEVDDNTTDTDDQDLGMTLVAGTYYLFTVDATDLGNVRFHVDDVLLGKFSMKDAAASQLLQPFIAVQKASGTGVPQLTVDTARVRWFRI